MLVEYWDCGISDSLYLGTSAHFRNGDRVGGGVYSHRFCNRPVSERCLCELWRGFGIFIRDGSLTQRGNDQMVHTGYMS